MAEAPACPEEPAADPEVPERIPVEAGVCDLRGVPESMREALDAEASARLVEEVDRWLNGEGGFVVVPRAGVLFAKSEDDIGADPPYPTSVQAQGIHACGVESGWLANAARQSLRARGGPYRNGPIRCQGNVCCSLARGEYDSAAGVVFVPRQGGSFAIRAVYQVADNGTLGGDFIAEQYRVVHGHLDRLSSRTCSGEPATPGG